MPMNILLPLLAITQFSPYWRGVDASFVPEYRDLGATFTVNGKLEDPLDGLARSGSNLLRLRVWVNPPKGYCDLTHTLKMALEAKRLKMDVLLNFHYSDDWADPQKQIKPKAWMEYSNTQLESAIEDHTREVIKALVKQGTPPTIIQIGNEVRDGMLWPSGQLTKGNLGQFVRFLKAAISVVRNVMPQNKKYWIMIHHDRGGDLDICQKFYDDLRSSKVDFDMIGVSYYPWWHGSLASLTKNLNNMANRYSLPVIVVETAYPFTLGFSDRVGNFVGEEKQLEPGYPATVTGQTAFISKLHSIVKSVPKNLGAGVCYWAPEYVAQKGIGTPYENLCLFNFEHEMLDGAWALGENNRK